MKVSAERLIMHDRPEKEVMSVKIVAFGAFGRVKVTNLMGHWPHFANDHSQRLILL